MLPISKKHGQLYGATETYELDNIADIIVANLKFHLIIVANLKFHLIIVQSEAYTYNTDQVIANCLKPLCSDNVIQNTQEFTKKIAQAGSIKFQ